MKVFTIKAKVLNMGSGALVRSAEILATTPEDAIEQFYKRFLTLEILEVTQ